MVIGQVATQALHARPRHASSAPAEMPAADRVDLSTCPKQRFNPWPELKELGLVASTQVVPGPLGGVLTRSAREGLRAALERIGKTGATFHTQNWDNPDSLDTVMKFVESNPAAKLGNSLGILMPGYGKLNAYNLDDVRTLDATTGLGESVLTRDEQKALDYKKELERGGASLNADSDDATVSTHDGAVLGKLRRKEWLYVHADGEHRGVKEADDLYANEFFYGAGRDLGLREPQLAADLKRCGELGIKLYSGEKEVLLRRWYALADDDDRKNLKTSLADNRLVATGVAELADPEALKARLEAVSQGYERSLGPVLRQYGKDPELTTQCLGAAVGPPDDKFPLAERMAIYGALLEAIMLGRGHEEYQITRLNELFAGLTERAGDSFQLAQIAEAIIPRLRDQGTAGVRRAQKDLALLDGRLGPRSQAQEEKALGLMKLTGSGSTALEALDTIRLQEPDRRDQHERLIADLANRLPAGQKRETMLHYRAMLTNRLEDDTLSSVSQRYLGLLAGVAPYELQADLRGVFGELQARAEGDPTKADRLAQSFLSHLALSGGIKEALDRASGSAASGVQTQGDVIVVGGIPIRRKA